MKNETIAVAVQAMYGNRTMMEIWTENIDALILGYMNGVRDIPASEQVDRTVLPIPGSDFLVLIYNRYKEMERLQDKGRYYEEDGYILKPLAFIPEQGIEIYSRCIACRRNSDGELESLKSEDWAVLDYYLAK